VLDRAIEDMKAGRLQVLVVWQSSRIEYAKDAYLNDASEMSDVILALAAIKDRKESQGKSERVRPAHARIDGNGAWRGRAPFGYAAVGDKFCKRLVPTDVGRDLAPEIFGRIAGGVDGGPSFYRPHLRGAPVHDWPLNVFDAADAAAQPPVLRAIAEADLRNLVF
jgi:DNA invertase Pin-like site-specific DNA recombinase